MFVFNKSVTMICCYLNKDSNIDLCQMDFVESMVSEMVKLDIILMDSLT